MEFQIIENHGHPILVVTSQNFRIENVQQSLDLMAEAWQHDSNRIVLQARHLHPDFFDLRTRLAGEILQKFANYRMKLAVIGSVEAWTGESGRAFILESNRGNRFFFLPDLDSAIARMRES